MRSLTRTTARRYGTTEFPLGDAILRLCTLEDTRGLIRLVGRDVMSFLQVQTLLIHSLASPPWSHQGIITNDVRHLEEKCKSPTEEKKMISDLVGSAIYAAMLTPKGRVAHDVFVHRDQVLVDSDRRSLTQLIAQLKMYRLRSEVAIEDVSTTHRVCCLFGDPTLTDSHRLDPRLSSLGYRFVAPLTSIPHASAIDASIYREWRFLHGVGEGRDEIPPEALPLEYNLDGLNGVSFSKGCYVGQELTARTHSQGIIRKRLLPVTLSKPMPDSAHGSEILQEPGNKKVGELRAVLGNHALAFLRLQPAFEALRHGQKSQLGYVFADAVVL